MLIGHMKRIAPGYCTERDGGRWYALAPNHDRIGEEFARRDDARRFVCWLAGDPLPDGWVIQRHGSGCIAYEIVIPGQYSATIWTRAVARHMPHHAATFPTIHLTRLL
jgi:hypothetical protein